MRRSARPSAAAAPTRGLAEYRAGRTVHPLEPFVAGAPATPSPNRLGSVLVAGCRDAAAARQLGFVPVGSVGAALGMARGTGAERIGFLLSPPYFPLVVAGEEARTLAEVRLANLLVVSSSFGLVREDDVAGLEDVAAVGGVERHQRVLLDEQDRRALRVDLADDLEDLLDEDRREPHRRLVEQQQLRPRHERAPDREHLLLAAGERSGLCSCAPQPREQVEDALEVLATRRRSLRW